jgi:hypothetical protein
MKKIITSVLMTLIFCGSLKAQIALSSGLAAFYPFTGNANDVGGSGLNGTVSNATLTSDRFGNPNCAYFYNGSTSYINYGNILNSVYAGTGNKFSVSVWIKPFANAAASGILTKDADGACSEGQQQFVLSVYNNKIMVIYMSALGGGNAVYATGNMTVTDTSHWYHVVMLYDGTVTSSLGRVNIYVDNTLNTISAALPMTGTLGNIQAGTAAMGSGTTLTSAGTQCAAPGYTYHGKIDDIRIYNRLLNASEIDAIYNGTTYVGVKEIEENISMSISPNPFNTFTTISFDQFQENSVINIIDILGKVVKTQTLSGNQVMIERADLNKGIYFVQIIDKKKNVTTRKIVIQ